MFVSRAVLQAFDELLKAFKDPKIREQFSGLEREILTEMGSWKVKDFSGARVSMVSTLHWRLENIKSGRHVRVKLPWEA